MKPTTTARGNAMHTSSENLNFTTGRIRWTFGRKLAGAAFVALIGAAAVPPAHAGLAEDIKAKVNNINTLTGRINTRTSNLVSKADEQVQRLDEVGATVNSVIAETDVIKRALEPLELIQQMKAKFAGGGFDPVELLDELDAGELREMIDDFKAKRAEAKASMNDPDLETFRAEFLETLDGLAEAVADSGVPEVSPLRGLIENAPPKVLSVVKVLTEDVFPDLRDGVQALAQIAQKLRDIGIFEDNMLTNPLGALPFGTMDKSEICTLSATGAYYSTYLLVASYQYHNSKIIERIKAFDVKVGGSALNTDQQIQIHGYIGVALNPGKELEERVKLVLNKLESRNKRAGYIKEAVKYTGQICEPLSNFY